MKKEIINGIKYRLDEDNLTAEVVQLKDDFELDEASLTTEKIMKMIFNHYEGDIIIPEIVVLNELTYRVERIGDNAFAHSSLKSVIIPESVTSIGEGAFKDCSKLESITIPDSVTSIGDLAFWGCDSLISKVEICEEIIGGIKYLLYCNRTAKIIEESGNNTGDVIIPESVVFNAITYRVTSIGARAFRQRDKLESITIPNSVTSIGERAFELCSSLTKIAIPNSVTSIGARAFELCSSLTKIAIPNTVTSIGEHAFDYCSKLTSIIIPDNVNTIGDGTFSWCFSLPKIHIPNSVTSIGYQAFEICTSLKSIIIPANVTEIGERAFVGCKALKSIIVAEGNPRYDSRDNCNAIIETTTNTLIQGCSQTIIPESVTEIGEEAFAGCDSLKSVNIPASVKSVGRLAFGRCENLTDITFQGTIAQWKDIKLSRSWKSDVPAIIVHCTDGDVQAKRY